MNLNIDISALRNNTQDAIEKGQQEAARKKAEEEATLLANLKKEKIAAELAISVIPALCQQAAANGENKVKVLSLSPHGHKDKMSHIGGFDCQVINLQWDTPGSTRINTHANYHKMSCSAYGRSYDILVCPLGYQVWNACNLAGLNPVWVEQDDGVGVASWFELWVSW